MKLEDYGNNNTKQVYTPEELEYRQDISPSGRLINLVLQEAPNLSLDALRYHQRQDPFFGEIIKEMNKNKEKTEHTNYAMKNGILIKQVNEETSQLSYTICVPKDLALELIGKFHYSIFGNHHDLKKLMINLKRRFFIKNLKQLCLQIIKNCQICALNKSFNIKKQPYGTKIAVTGPREIYCLDICTVDTKAKEIDENLPTSFLIIVDAWSLYTIAVPIKENATAKEIIELFLKHIIMPFGFPKTGIVTDGGKNFSNKLTNTFTSTFNLQQFRISPYNARANPAERINRSILSAMRYAMQQHSLNPEVYKNLLNYVVLGWNTSALSSISYSPYELFLSTSYEPACLTSFVTIQEAEKDYSEFISALIKTQTFVQNLVNERYQQIRDKRYKEKEKRSKYSEYKEGTEVMVKKRIDQTERQHKLRPRYTGPYKIVKEYENNCEIIPWMKDRKIKFIDKYHNEARNVPKHEKYLISKDRLKPCSKLTFYYDDQLSRAFYQLFWDAIKDVQPIHQVERHTVPDEHLDKIPRSRPSSLLLPAKVGIKEIPLRKEQTKIKNKKREIRRKMDQESTSDENDDDDQHKDDGRIQNIENIEEINRYENIDNRNQREIEDRPIRPRISPPRQLGARPKTFANPGKLQKSGQLAPWRTARKTQQRQEPTTIIEGNTGTVIMIPEQRPSTSGTNREHQEIEETDNENQQINIEDNTNKSTKSKQSRKSRIDPAIKEMLTSENTLFHDQAFESLKEYYKEGNVDKAFSELSQQLEDSFSEVEELIINAEEEENQE